MYDTHAHLISDDVAAYPPAPLSGELRAGSMDDPMTAERLLKAMDALGVERAVAVQRAHVYGYDNRYVVDAARRHPDRLKAVCVLDATAPDAVEAVRRWVGDGGAVGVRLTEPRKGADLSWFASDAADAVWRETTALGASICLQFYRWNRDAALAALPAVLDRHPGTSVVIDHVTSLIEGGAPDFGVDPALAALAPYRRVAFKVTTINFARLAAAEVRPQDVLRKLVAVFGAERLMWGSDVAQSPQPYEEMVRMARSAVEGLEAEIGAALLADSAVRFY